MNTEHDGWAYLFEWDKPENGRYYYTFVKCNCFYQPDPNGLYTQSGGWITNCAFNEKLKDDTTGEVVRLPYTTPEEFQKLFDAKKKELEKCTPPPNSDASVMDD